MEYKSLRKDGSLRIAERSISLVRDKSGNPVGFRGIGRDITARKHTEERLKESEKKYREILESIEEGYYELDLAGNFIFVNSAMSNHLGYSKDELIGMNYRNFSHEATAKKTAELFNQLYRTGEPIKAFDIEYIRKDGTEGFTELSASLIRDEAGKPIGFRTLSWDVTARRQAEEALRENTAQLDLALRSAGLGAWHLDISPYKLYYDEQVCHLRGIDPSTFSGTREEFIEAVHPDDRAMIGEALSKAIAQDEIYRGEYRVVWPDGSVHYISTRGKLVRDDADRPMRFNGIVWDITAHKQEEGERQKLQERLQRAEKMESIGTLAGGVAHDLNNVLGVVAGYAELLLGEVDQASPLRPDLTNIMEAGHRAAAIVQDLLTLARRGVACRKVISLNKTIADFQKSPEFMNLASYHPSVKINTDLEPDLLNISGSSVHLGKTLFNLLSNASEAMPKGGTVTIKTANQYLDGPIQGYDEIREGDYIVISVSDSGEGIPAADLKRIFEPFYTKKVMGRSGTGLGLAVVWGTVKDHNGYINVQSEEGKGSIFTLYFPVTREDITAEAAAISMSEYMGCGESILIVDDIKGQCDLAASMLRKLNYKVSSVSSGEEAIIYLKDHQTNLIVLDMIMEPGMDGLETFNKVLEVHPQQKAIIVSGYSESERVHAAQVLGAGAYVRKPYVLEKLGLAVRDELDRK